MDQTPSEGLSILAALTQLKDEIRQAQDKAIVAGELPMFFIEEGELELKLVARRENKLEGSVKGAFKLFVLDSEINAAGSRTGTNESTQTLKIKFKAARHASSNSTPTGGQARKAGGGLFQDPLIEVNR